MPFRPVRDRTPDNQIKPPLPNGSFAPTPSGRSNVSPRKRTRPTFPRSDDNNGKSADAIVSIKRAHHKVDRPGSNWDENGDYIVGKNRPPREGQWKPGQSGNPRGPVKRETLTPEAQFEKDFLKPFSATVNGEMVPLTMDVFVVQSLKSAAAKGSVKAAQILLDLYMKLIRKAAEQDLSPEIDSWEKESIDRLLAELGLPEKPVIRQTNRSGPRP